MKNGRIFYQGPTDGLLQWLNSYQFMCPPNFDLGDFTMDVLHTHSTKDLTDMNMFMPLPSDSASSIGIQYIDDMSAYFIEQWRVAEEAPGSELPEAAYVAAWWLQCTWLLYREALNIGRNLPALKGRFGITIFISAMLAIIFNNVAKGNNADSADFQAHNGAITAIAIVSMFGSAIITLMEFPTERPLFVREHASGTYGAVPYFFSKAILELPLTLLQNVIGFLIVYWVVGFRGEFVYFVLSGWLISLTSASLATVAGSIIPDPKQAVGVAPILFVPQIMFAGFFIPTSQIPFWFRWIQYICGLKYGVNLYLINEFSLTRPSCDDAAEFNCRRVLDSNDIDANKWYIYVCIMLGIYIALRSLACAILAKLAMKPI